MRKIEIIAECGVSHNGSLDVAAHMIKCAKEAGADVAKFQLFNAERLIEEINPNLPEYNKKWVKLTELSKDDLALLSKICKEHEIEFMCSVFEPALVEWLEEINVKRYKVPKFLSTDLSLLRQIFLTDKEMIISGAPVNYIKGARYLYCVSNYPTTLEELDFRHDMFDRCYDGFSDHTIGVIAPIVAMSLGAKIIEKHFTLDRTFEGPDHNISAIPEELEMICKFRDGIEIIRS